MALSLFLCRCTVGSLIGDAVATVANADRSAFFSALERLQALKRGPAQAAINSREALRFLDRVTSGKDSISSDRVILQGPMEQYETWADVEQFFLPEFEEEIDDGVYEATEIADRELSIPQVEEEVKINGNAKMAMGGPGLPGLSSDLSQMLLSKLNFKKEPEVPNGLQRDIKSSVSPPSTGTQSAPGSRSSSRSSQTSPGYTNGTIAKAAHSRGHQRSGSTASIPPSPDALRPLLSALLWAAHAKDGVHPVKNITLVTNDPDTQIWAQKYGIMTKNIHQLRTAIQYEEKEFKNRVKYVEKTQHGPTDPKPLFSYDNNESEEDELVFVPRGRGKGAARGVNGRGGNGRKPAASKHTSSAVPVETTVEVSQPIDPNSFSRSLGPTTAGKQPGIDLSSPAGVARGLAASSRRNGGARRSGGSRASSSRGGSRGRGKLWAP
jgi:hypothetical protein